MSKNKNIILLPLLLLVSFVGLYVIPMPESQGAVADATYPAEIEAILNETIEGDTYLQEIRRRINSGPDIGKRVTILNDESFARTHRDFQVGDEVMLTENPVQETYYISDYVRSDALIWLFAIFIAIVLAVTGWQGLGSLLGMALSFMVMFKIVLPMIIAGGNPVTSAIIGAAFIIPLTFYSSHGFSRKTTIAVAGTFITLVLSGILAVIFADVAHLTGLASEEIIYLREATADAIDFKGLVLAGMIISILGVLDDITISQASVVSQLKGAKKSIKFSELFTRAMKVGKDHIASLVNTLILVYTGASLPLLILFIDSAQSITEIINYEFMAEEIVRTLIGSIGLIMAVPITTILAAFFIGKGNSEEHSHCCH